MRGPFASGIASGLRTGGGELWLIDATTYRPRLRAELESTKRTSFRLEAIARERHLGGSGHRGSRTFSAGLLRLGTIARAWGYDVHFVHLDQALAELERSAPPDGPACIGFGTVCPTVPACAALARYAKARYPRCRLVLGGAHAMVASAMTSTRFDCFDEVTPTSGIAAALTLLGLRRTPAPVPAGIDYSLLPLPVADYGFNLMTSLGCPFTCAYCQDRDRPWETGALDGGLADVLPRLAQRTHVHFADSVLGGSARRAIDVCRAIERLEHDLYLSCDLRPEFVRPGLLDRLVAAGFREIRLGLDSGDDSVLFANHRRAPASKLSGLLETVKQSWPELFVSIYLVTGLPGTTTATSAANLESIDHLLGSGLADQVKHHLYVPYPRDDCPSSHPAVRIINLDWSAYDRNSPPVYELLGMKAETIWESFLDAEATINDVWQHRLHVSDGYVTEHHMCSDYNAAVYLSRGGELIGDLVGQITE